MLSRLKELGIRLSLGHHEQALLFVLAALFLSIRAWWALLGLVLYCTMHFQYGGGGTFQRPPRDDTAPATIADLLYVSIGICGLLLVVGGLGKRIIDFFR